MLALGALGFLAGWWLRGRREPSPSLFGEIEAHRWNEERFEDFAKSSAHWFWEMDENLRYSYFSDHFEEITGVSSDYLMGKKREETGITGIPAEMMQRQLDDLENHRAFEDFVFPRPQPDGTVRWLSNNGRPVFDKKGTFKGYRGTGRDVTRIKETEIRLLRNRQLLRTILDTVPTTISVKGLDRRYRFVNRYQAQWLFGVEPEEVVGKTMGDLLGTEMGEIADQNDRKVIETGLPLINFEEEIPDFKGRKHTVLTTKVPLLDEQGQVDGVITAALNISKRKKMENDLRESRERAEKANRAKSDFLASMSHDLRTPLNAILGFSEIFMLKTFGELGHKRYEEYADLIYKSGQQLLLLINDILDLSKIESGEYHIVPARNDLRAASSYVLRIFSAELIGKDISLTGEFDAVEHIWLEADPKALNQILNNLVSNAVRFTPKGGAVSVSWRLSANGECILAVRDTGCGISDEDLVHLTEPFYQAKPHVARADRGTGLGLYICRRLAELHDGHIRINSEVNAGTKVEIIFPADRVVLRTASRENPH
ncbi:PAS domain S-box-containing protein [Aestuariispira insulae]|uniref:histidine kinase n=2 Tax=Aestuariispira insulae TaxID=1461337 RepID=A0A3D9H417_9PROT|nr:PAS domain S-box-containing protein [Aestuariispira insulae]